MRYGNFISDMWIQTANNLGFSIYTAPLHVTVVLWQPLVRKPIITQAINLKTDIKWESQENSTRSLCYIPILFIQSPHSLC